MIHRAKTIENGKWITGIYIETVPPYSYIITKEQLRKSRSPLYPNDGNITSITAEAVRVMGNTVGRCSDVSDLNDKMIFEGDIVRFFGMTGEIVYESGAFGIGCNKTIDYDTLENSIPYANNPYFCYNDNFISLWELIWNFGHTDNPFICDAVEVIGNKYDNPELLPTR